MPGGSPLTRSCATRWWSCKTAYAAAGAASAGRRAAEASANGDRGAGARRRSQRAQRRTACAVFRGPLVFPAPRASGRGSPGRLLPALAMRPGLTPTFDGFGQEPPGITGAAPGGRAPATGLPGVMEAAPPRRPGPAASGWPKPSKVGAERVGGDRGGCRSRRRPRCAIGCGIPAERTAALLEGMAAHQRAGAQAARLVPTRLSRESTRVKYGI